MNNAIEHLRTQLSKANPVEANNFCNSLNTRIRKIQDEYGMVQVEPINFQRIAFLFSGHSNRLAEDVVVKIIPDYLATYMYESAGYRALSSNYMCPVLSFEDDMNAIIMKKLSPSDKNDKKAALALLESVAADSPVTPASSPMYYDVWQRTAKEAELLNPDICNGKQFKINKSLSDEIWASYFTEETSQICHCDLHYGNIMQANGKLYAIDPLAYVAPYPFRFTRTILIPALYDGASEEAMINRMNNIVAVCHGKLSMKAISLATVCDANFLIQAYCVQFQHVDKLHVFNAAYEAAVEIAKNYL